MGTVTIAASFGAGGSVVGPAVAGRLGLPFVDRAIPVQLAEQVNQPLLAALADDERRHRNAVRHLLERAVASCGLFLGVPMPLDQLGADEHVAASEEAIRRMAEGEGAVILGRGGVFVLQGRPNVLHVRLDGPVEARRRQAMTHEGIDYATAAARQEQADRARAAYVAHFHPEGGRWDDARHYHLVLDSTAIPLEVCVEMITLAARRASAPAALEPAQQP
jgi:cytidylate kinase